MASIEVKQSEYKSAT